MRLTNRVWKRWAEGDRCWYDQILQKLTKVSRNLEVLTDVKGSWKRLPNIEYVGRGSKLTEVEGN